MAKTTLAINANYGVATYDDGHQDHAIWINGESLCNYAFLGPNSESPCDYNGGQFALDGQNYRYVNLLLRLRESEDISTNIIPPNLSPEGISANQNLGIAWLGAAVRASVSKTPMGTRYHVRSTSPKLPVVAVPTRMEVSALRNSITSHRFFYGVVDDRDDEWSDNELAMR